MASNHWCFGFVPGVSGERSDLNMQISLADLSANVALIRYSGKRLNLVTFQLAENRVTFLSACYFQRKTQPDKDAEILYNTIHYQN